MVESHYRTAQRCVFCRSTGEYAARALLAFVTLGPILWGNQQDPVSQTAPGFFVVGLVAEMA